MIQVIKLLSGEELVGDVSIVDGVFVVKQPCYLQLVPSRTDPSNTMMSLIPYAMYLENHTIMIKEENVLWSGKPVAELYNQYNNVFGTGIQLV